MTIPLWCLLVVASIPYILAGLGGYLRVRQLGSIDQHYPRIQATELRGVAARAYAAQQNAWEAVALFSTAVIVAHLTGADAGWSAVVAVAFAVTRVLHATFYIADLPPLRTGVFVLGLLCCVSLFGLAIGA